MLMKNRCVLMLTLLNIGFCIEAAVDISQLYKRFLDENKPVVEVICRGMAILENNKDRFNEWIDLGKESTWNDNVLLLIKKLPKAYECLSVWYSVLPNAAQCATTFPRNNDACNTCARRIRNHFWRDLRTQAFFIMINGEQKLTDEQQYYMENLPEALLAVSKEEKEVFDKLREREKKLELRADIIRTCEKDIIKIYPDYAEVKWDTSKNKEKLNNLKISNQKKRSRLKGLDFGYGKCEAVFADDKETCDLCKGLVTSYVAHCILQKKN